MATGELRDDEWSRMLQFLRSCPGVYAGQDEGCQRFIEDVLWMARSDAQWRLLPESYGNWNSIYKRFARWCDKGVWERMHQHFVEDPDMENIMLDSTVVSLIGEQWSPKMAPSSTAAAARTTSGKPPISKASGSMVGRRRAMVVHDVPIEKATTAASRKTRTGSIAGASRSDREAIK